MSIVKLHTQIDILELFHSFAERLVNDTLFFHHAHLSYDKEPRVNKEDLPVYAAIMNIQGGYRVDIIIPRDGANVQPTILMSQDDDFIEFKLPHGTTCDDIITHIGVAYHDPNRDANLISRLKSIYNVK